MQKLPEPNHLLSVSEAARVLGVSVSWMNKKRLVGGGCPYLKLGRRVLYDLQDIDTWCESHRRTHTSES